MKFYDKTNNKFGLDSFISKSELLDQNSPIVTDNKIIIGFYIRIYKKDKYGKV